MMDKYFYMVSQLPTLMFDRENPITTAAFLEEAGKWMSGRDLKVLKSVRLFGEKVQGKAPTLLRLLQEFEDTFRNELGQWRQAQREDGDYKPETFSPSLVKEGNPLEIEKKLLKVRWDKIESEESEHHFDLGLLILYYLKLQILDRLSVFDKELGMEKFQTMSRVTV